MAPDHEVAIIGAGLSGLGMGAALRRVGIEDFVIFERAHDVGGTWRDNTYPGVGVDIPTFAYQFSYELKPDWSRVFAKGPEVKDYIDEYVVKYDLARHLRFDSEVTARTWDEEHHVWRLRVNGGETTARSSTRSPSSCRGWIRSRAPSSTPPAGTTTRT
jgi:cation diffusion facilitator CzcD-associated flavoprotein CzcO